MEDVCNVNGPRPIGTPLPRTLYPLPKPNRLSEDAEKAYLILHPDEPLPDYDELLRNHPHLAEYDDNHHHFFGTSEEALQEGTLGSKCVFDEIDVAAAGGERFFISEQDQDLLDRTFKVKEFGPQGSSSKLRYGKRSASTKIEKLQDSEGNKSKKAKKNGVRMTTLPHHGDEGSADSFPSSNQEVRFNSLHLTPRWLSSQLVEAWLCNITANALVKLANGEAAPQSFNYLLSEPHTPQQTSSAVPAFFESFDHTDTTGLFVNVGSTPADPSHPINNDQLQCTAPAATSEATRSLDEVEQFTDVNEEPVPIYDEDWYTNLFGTGASDASPLAGRLPMTIPTTTENGVDGGNDTEDMSTYFSDITDREVAALCEGEPSMLFHHPATPTRAGAFSDYDSFNTGIYEPAGPLTIGDAVLPESEDELLELRYDS